MQKAEAQHTQTHNQPAQRQGRGASLESPQGEQIAQLEAMAEASPQTNKLAQLAATVNDSPRMAAQRKAIRAIHNSPNVMAQRQQLDTLTGEIAQREETEEPLQPKVTQREEAPAQPNASTQLSTGNTGLPDNLKSGIESLSGMSMDNVRVHYNSSQPAQLNALAYAQGTDIHVAPGQEQHLPHEAWHVVQQAQGRVQPTMQMKDGVPVNDDQGLEHEADVMGGRAAQMMSGASEEKGRLNSLSTHVISAVDQAGGTAAPIQRLVGFEVEYQVPTYGPATESVSLQGGENAPNSRVKTFLFGGLAYGSELGGSAKPGDDAFRVTSDHKSAISREPIRAKLASMGKLDPADTMDRDASSNLEYVTSPVDELVKGADKKLGAIIDGLSDHANATYGLATKDTLGVLPAPATKVATGVAASEVKAWLNDEDFQKVEPEIKKLQGNIADSCYLQATIGVLPSAIGRLMAAASSEDSLFMTGGKFDDIYAAIDTASLAMGLAVKDHSYIKSIAGEHGAVTRKSLSGILRLLVMYLVGEALSQTTAFPGGTIKNAVPFLVKIDPSQILSTGDFGLTLFDEVTDEFVTAVATALSSQKEITVDYWTGRGYEAQDREVTDKVTAGTVENLVRMFLQGKKPPSTGIQTGSRLKGPDKMDQIHKDSSYQTGIPVEYRYIKARPSASGLKAELMKIVEQAREVNLGSVPEERRNTIREQVKE